MHTRQWHIAVTRQDPSTLHTHPLTARSRQLILTGGTTDNSMAAPGELLYTWLNSIYYHETHNVLFVSHWRCWVPPVRRRRVIDIQRAVANSITHSATGEDVSNDTFSLRFRPCFLYLPSPSKTASRITGRQTVR